MDPATLTAGTFQLSSGTTVLPGTVIYADSTAVFWPAVHLTTDGSFTATSRASREARDRRRLRDPGQERDLHRAPRGHHRRPRRQLAAASYITGFSLAANATNVFSTSPQVTGKIYAANNASPTPAKMTSAVGDMELAFTGAAGRARDVRELGAGNIGGMTLTPGVYKWGTGLLIPTSITLTGGATAVWIFQIAPDLTLSSATQVLLAGGALAKNVFWQVSGRVVLGTTAHLEGVVLTHTSITLRTGASIKGRLLAQTAVSIDGSTVVQP